MNFAKLVARRIWAGMLWTIRRRPVRRLQRRMLSLLPPRLQTAVLGQEKFARRHGLRLMTIVVGLFFMSLAFSAVYVGMTEVFNRGWIALPEPQEGQGAGPYPKPSGTRKAVEEAPIAPLRPTSTVPTEH